MAGCYLVNIQESYGLLRPRTDIRHCDCLRVEQLLLVYTLEDNPIQCFRCKGTVDPEAISLSEAQVEAVGSWRRVFGALYDLWLDSGEYEAWAKGQLLRRGGEVNVKGMATRATISETLPTFYWWFRDTDDPVPTSCPWCEGEVVPATRHGEHQCHSCWIVI
jgi:hypothetical protein